MASKTLTELLTNLNTLCTRCVLRYTTSNLQSSVGDLNDTHERHCSVCFGILEQQQIDKAAEMVSTELKNKGYTAPTFTFSISFPQCMILRQKALLTHIKENNLYSEVEGARLNIFPDVKDILKSVLLPKIEQSTLKKFAAESSLLVRLEYFYPGEDKEIKTINKLLPEPSKKRKFQHKNNKTLQKSPLNNLKLVTETIEDINDCDVQKYTQVPPTTVQSPCEIKIHIVHDPIYIAGRYNKYSRELSQTPWIIDGVRKTEYSVQELICEKLMEYTGSKDVKFMSSGREDCDVRMLGRGRPFVVGLMNPRVDTIASDHVTKLFKEINQSTEIVAVRDLQLIDKVNNKIHKKYVNVSQSLMSRDALSLYSHREGLVLLKSGEEEKKKCYCAKVWCPDLVDDEKIKHLNSLTDITLKQTTPIRVVHRRPLMVRERMVYNVNMTRLDEHHYQLELKTQAGTYIKEFVHSDFGRTSPSLCSLMDAPFDILELDVNEVELEWPPRLDDQTMPQVEE